MFEQRRQFLQLASAAMSVPFLPISKGFAQGGKPPLRLLTIVESYGHNVNARGRMWIRSEMGDYALQESDLGTILKPISGYIENLIVPTGIDVSSLQQMGGGTGHDTCAVHTLTGSKPAGGRQVHPSLDVRVGQYLSEEYGLSAQRAIPHVFMTDYADAGRGTFPFGLDGRQIRSRAGIKAILSTFFADVGEPSVLDRVSNEARMEILGLVGERLQTLRPQLVNANASTVLDAYRSSVEDLAGAIAVRAGNACAAPDVPQSILNAPVSRRASSGRVSPYIFDAIYHAMACDLASSITYAPGGELNNLLTYEHLADRTNEGGVKSLLNGIYHRQSHRNGAEVDATSEIVRTHHFEMIANLLDRLKATPDVDGQSTMLDNTVIFVHCAQTWNQHKIDNAPVAIIAGKNSRLKGGMHYDCGNCTNNQLLATVGKGLDLPENEFGGFNGTNRIASLNAGGPIEKMLKRA